MSNELHSVYNILWSEVLDARKSSMSSLASQIEAILYLKGKPLAIAEIAEYANCDKETAEEALIQLINDYAHRDSALEVLETENGYSLQLRETFQDFMHRLIPAELGVGALRTLAAIALKGPLSQTDLVELRGSGAYQHVQELVQQGFVRKRRQPETRSFSLQVTAKFHQYFQLDQLPKQLELPFQKEQNPEIDEPDEFDETPEQFPEESPTE